MLLAVPLPLVLPFVLLLSGMPQTTGCADLTSCREAALEAASRKDYESFHDLAWRAVQRGRPNDPELMYLLARAQSLSGRPGDALVMLRRLASMGAAAEAREHEDFARVRALSGWPDVEALLLSAAEGRTAEAVIRADPPPPARAAPAEKEATAGAPKAGAPVARGTVPAARSAAAPARGGEALRLPALGIEPVALAYDSASQRFVLADRRANKLIVADDVFSHVNDLAGPASAGFGTVTALAIDGRRGDLWVTSNAADGAASIHKLQLVSGRALSRRDIPADLLPALFSDIAVTDGGTLLLADSAGSRLLRMNPASGALEREIRLGAAAPSSVTAAGDVAYVAHDAGLTRADLRSGRLTEIRAAPDVTLEGLQRIRWYGGSLIAIQRAETGARLVKILLGRGGTVASSIESLDDDRTSSGPALTISRDAAYYLADGEGDPVIRRVPLR